jgi:hypothetical protein
MCYTATILRYLGVLPAIPPHERGRRCVRALRRFCMRIPTGSELGSPQGRSSTLLQLPSREQSLDTGDSADREQSPCGALFSDPQRVGEAAGAEELLAVNKHASELRAWHHHSSLLASCIAFFKHFPGFRVSPATLSPGPPAARHHEPRLGVGPGLLLTAAAGSVGGRDAGPQEPPT